MPRHIYTDKSALQIISSVTPAPISLSQTEAVPCAIYARSATEEDTSPEKSSVVIQQQHCIREIWKRCAEGWVHRVTLSDPCCSGCSADRLGLQLLIELAKARKIKVVVVYKRERLFRGLDLAVQVQAIFNTHGVKVFSCIEGIHDGGPCSAMMRHMLDASAQFDRAIIKHKIQKYVVPQSM